LGNTKSASVEVRQIKLSAASTFIREENQMQIFVSGGKSPYSCSSNRSFVATINSSGRLTARNEGNVTITATDDDGFSASINITVLNKKRK